MSQLEYTIKHRGLTPKRLLKKITRRGFGASVLSGLTGAGALRLRNTLSVEAAGADFTIAIIPDPQFLAESCPDNFGGYYAAMMQWIVDNEFRLRMLYHDSCLADQEWNALPENG